MIAFTWKVLNLYSQGDLITGIKYQLTGFNGTISIVSEGVFTFADPKLVKPFASVTEQDCIAWLEKETQRDGQSHVKSGIERQFKVLQSKEAPLPWKPKTFKIGI